MPPTSFEIQPYHASHRQQLLEVWEQAVCATHAFLTPPDFEEIKLLVASIDFADLQVFCLVKADSVLGFVGVANSKIEMLFLRPAYFGQGMGRKLLRFAVDELKADTLDVNAQNTKAISFYQQAGFEMFERTEVDDQGRAYPLLRMRLASPNQ